MHIIAEVDRAAWIDQACRISTEPDSDRTLSEVQSLVRGLRWVKDTEEAQSALDVLCGSRVVRDGARVPAERVEEIISKLCKFTDLEER